MSLRTVLAVPVLSLLLTTPALANGAAADFEGGVNLGAWTYGPPDVLETSGGNPGGWLHQPGVDTFAPQVRTTGSSAFTGDWRAEGVTGFSVDLITISTQFAFARPLTLMVTGGGSTVYFLGSAQVPQPGTGWKSFSFDVPSASTTLPAGWTVQSGGDPDAAWNAVMTDVTEVRFFYGDPTLFFIFDIWNVGIDNATLICGTPITDLGNGLAGTGGLVPALDGLGTLQPGTTTKLRVSDGPANGSAYLLLGVTNLSAPFKGGVLVPSPDVILAGLPLDASGTLLLSFPWPAGIPSGSDLFWQAWMPDAGGPAGFSATNGLQTTTP